ncbi:PadR family transcriptional regulator [Chloroflexota bacterium]|nr:PadR family transcriptional regulator [Chloroflexota bacterium]
MDNNIEKYMPLSESTYYILLILLEPLHGYGVMQKVEALTGGQVVIGPGTLYGAFSTLEKEELIMVDHVETRRKYYKITEKGKKVLYCQFVRLEMMTENGRELLEGSSGAGIS